VAVSDPVKPLAFSLSPNAPNLFNPTTIRFGLPEAGPVRLVVYNTTGQVVRTLVDGHRAAGFYAVTWDGRDALGRDVSSGVYLYCLAHTAANRNDSQTNSNAVRVRRMVLLR